MLQHCIFVKFLLRNNPNKQKGDSIISLDILSHSNMGGIHISRKLDQPVKSPRLKRTLHDRYRDDQNAEDALYMEESYHGLYTSALAAMGVGIYFNQQAGYGLAFLLTVNFDKFANDTRVEFHGCRTAEEIKVNGVPIPNFARVFSAKLRAAGKTKADVIGHASRVGIKGCSYQYGHRRRYRDGKIVEEFY